MGIREKRISFNGSVKKLQGLISGCSISSPTTTGCWGVNGWWTRAVLMDENEDQRRDVGEFPVTRSHGDGIFYMEDWRIFHPKCCWFRSPGKAIVFWDLACSRPPKCAFLSSDFMLRIQTKSQEQQPTDFGNLHKSLARHHQHVLNHTVYALWQSNTATENSHVQLGFQKVNCLHIGYFQWAISIYERMYFDSVLKVFFT